MEKKKNRRMNDMEERTKTIAVKIQEEIRIIQKFKQIRFILKKKTKTLPK